MGDNIGKVVYQTLPYNAVLLTMLYHHVDPKHSSVHVRTMKTQMTKGIIFHDKLNSPTLIAVNISCFTESWSCTQQGYAV